MLEQIDQSPTDDGDSFPADYAHALVIPEQPATYVYANAAGAVVVRQVAQVYSDDPFIIVRPEYTRILCDAIMAVAAKVEAEGGAA